MKKLFWSFCLMLVLTAVSNPIFASDGDGERWSTEKANQWYSRQPWLVGCNYVPAYAVNQLEMWQAETFDLEAIDRELALAEDLGFNLIRVFLHDVMWEADPDGFKKRIDEFLAICQKRKIGVMLTFFTNGGPGLLGRIGKQPAPIPGVHNSQWIMSPGVEGVNNPAHWKRLEQYVKDILATFGNDDRVLIWDLYNEPEKTNNGAYSLPLLHQVFVWARSVNPSQPLTASLDDNAPVDAKGFNPFLLKNCDIITIHVYGGPEKVERFIKTLQKFGRPVLCTEYLARNFGNTFEAMLPLFKRERVAALHWGFVAGKIQTQYPWDSREKPYTAEPKVWFHDIFRPDFTPYDVKEIDFIKKILRDDK